MVVITWEHTRIFIRCQIKTQFYTTKTSELRCVKSVWIDISVGDPILEIHIVIIPVNGTSCTMKLIFHF